MRRGGAFYVFLTCVLAVPTGVYMMPGITADRPETAIAAGVILGIIHVLLRPLLRLVTMPFGCLTLGLAGLVIDVGLIYLADYLVTGFSVDAFAHALLLALLINVICAVTGGRRR